MSLTTILPITNDLELAAYIDELNAAIEFLRIKKKGQATNPEFNNKNKGIIEEIKLLNTQIIEYQLEQKNSSNAEEAKQLKQSKLKKYYSNQIEITKQQYSESTTEYKDELELISLNLAKYTEQVTAANSKTLAIENNLVTPAAKIAWPFLLGVGLILKEGVIATAKILSKVLFPLHFAVDGLRSAWDIVVAYRNKKMQQRKTVIATHAINLAGIVAAAAVVGSAVVAPLALPIIFAGLSIAGFYRTASGLSKSKAILKETKYELANVCNYLNSVKSELEVEKNLKKVRPNEANKIEELNCEITFLESKQKRLKIQLDSQETTRQQAAKGLALDAVGIVAISALIVGAVLTLAFPPVAAALATAGLVTFAAVSIVNAVTSPAFIAKAKNTFNKFKNFLLGKKEYELIPTSPSHSPKSDVKNNTLPESGSGNDNGSTNGFGNSSTAKPTKLTAAAIATSVVPNSIFPPHSTNGIIQPTQDRHNTRRKSF
jgi:hypothetical protein